MSLKVLILGSGAGGGVPQWNCACKNCGNTATKVRTQSSIALSKNDWKSVVLVNSSPDFATQVRQNSKYLQARETRKSPITDIILTDSHIDHVTGLLSMRESDKLNIHCTTQVQEDLFKHFNLFDTLSYYTNIEVNTIVPNQEFMVNDICLIGLPIQGKAPPYSPRRNHSIVGDTLALVAEDKLLYAPALESLDSTELLMKMNMMQTILIDGTCYHNDDMIMQGLGTKSASDMGHINMSDSLNVLESLDTSEKYFIHINNSNPVLHDSKLLDKSSIELSYDGQLLFL